MSWQKKTTGKIQVPVPQWFVEAKKAGKSEAEITKLARKQAEEALCYNVGQNSEKLPPGSEDRLAGCIYAMYERMYELSLND